ncbi:hypothetical protein, partial [Fulvivirga sp.]|uniref:hypothetical protein n=1 Tax=Fulvivirga sp. TaxID=1931237 RepID=UPI0032EAF0AD
MNKKTHNLSSLRSASWRRSNLLIWVHFKLSLNDFNMSCLQRSLTPQKAELAHSLNTLSNLEREHL